MAGEDDMCLGPSRNPTGDVCGIPTLLSLLETSSTQLRMQPRVQRCVKAKVDRHQSEGLKVECTSYKRRKPERCLQGRWVSSLQSPPLSLAYSHQSSQALPLCEAVSRVGIK